MQKFYPPKSDKKSEEEQAEPLPIVYGRHPVIEALQRGDTFEKIFILQGTRGEFEKEVRQLCKEREVLLQVVPKERLAQYTKQNHQGILGIVSPIQYYDLEDVLPAIYERGEVPLLILLDSVTDVRNVGAIVRSAELAGAHTVIVPKKGAATLNSEAIKTSAGALNILPICRTGSLVNTVEYLLLNGIQVIAADIRGKAMLHELDFNQPTAIVMGAEGRGVNPALLQKSLAFKIPMIGKTDSFNVSVAAGMVLYESMRQRLYFPPKTI